MVAIDNVPTFQSEVRPAGDLTALINKYQALTAPLANRIIGSITANITEVYAPSGESPAGNLIADAQLAATASSTTGNAVVAFMNPGGVRTERRIRIRPKRNRRGRQRHLWRGLCRPAVWK